MVFLIICLIVIWCYVLRSVFKDSKSISHNIKNYKQNQIISNINNLTYSDEDCKKYKAMFMDMLLYGENDEISKIQDEIVTLEELYNLSVENYNLERDRFNNIPRKMKDTEYYRKYFKRCLSAQEKMVRAEHRLSVAKQKLTKI